MIQFDRHIFTSRRKALHTMLDYALALIIGLSLAYGLVVYLTI
jgi:hypothetical protein